MSSIKETFQKAWEEFVAFYRIARKKYDYKGYNENTKSSDSGPHFWSEQDIKFHLSKILQEYFGKFWVHNELSIAKHTFENCQSNESKRERIDIVISNPDNYQENWRKTHDAFIEVK